MDNLDKALLLPLLAQIALTFVIGLLAFKARFTAVKQGKVALSYFKHNRGKSPETMLAYGDNYQNQFELPVLFYLLISLLFITEQNSLFFTLGAWVFVISRILHAYIHVTSNAIMPRMQSFVFGFLTLLTLWIGFALVNLLS
ncbi:MAG: MAPEG family protein [Gammaproteobacteria bacterium]|nr:MAPEG family protein [Gammaproteobacteria bacterium]